MNPWMDQQFSSQATCSSDVLLWINGLRVISPATEPDPTSDGSERSSAWQSTCCTRVHSLLHAVVLGSHQREC